MKTLCALILVLMVGAAYGQTSRWVQTSPSGCKAFTLLDGNIDIEWDGGCNAGLIHGLGSSKLYLDKKLVYEATGNFFDGKLDGLGTKTFANGNKYEGEWRDGKRSGQGTFKWADGEKYVGEYAGDKRNGQGITFSANESIKQSGIYKDGTLVTSQYIDPKSFARITKNNLLPSSESKLSGEASNQEIEKTQVAGEWINTDKGCKLWNPMPARGETVTWTGLCKNGFISGYGTQQWYLIDKVGNKVVGLAENGKLIDGQISITFPNGEKYFGGWRNFKVNGVGTRLFTNGDKYEGEFRDYRRHGKGVLTKSDGTRLEGIWSESKFVRAETVTLPLLPKEIKLDDERQYLAEEVRRPEEGKSQRQQAKQTSRISITATATQPDSSGVVIINIQTNTDTSSLKINGEELGGKPDGSYSVKKVARVGQETKFTIAGIDVNGNTDSKTITVSRTVVESKVTYQQLNPDRVKRQPERDAVAVIIGISNYKSLPKAEFAKDDAQVFYDYAIRALGVKPGNIKLLMDEQADAEEIYTAFKTWLPARVKSTTDVYVFYSGHGLPTQDGSGLYWLPQRANRDLISKTGILLSEVNSDIQASKPKSVTIFMDACYSGQARGGETLVASARPIALKSQPTTFPSNFTVISASQADQISSSSPELQHGIFSYYLMRGMEGEADLNKDGKITLNETQAYLSENVGRHARIMNRQQEPQVIGDGARVLVGR